MNTVVFKFCQLLQYYIINHVPIRATTDMKNFIYQRIFESEENAQSCQFRNKIVHILKIFSGKSVSIELYYYFDFSI